MTLSLHKFGDYFPGTGDLRDIGAGIGKYYSVNFPLRDGIDDASYKSVFRPIVGKIMEVYKPGAVVLQCGADSLTGDRLGCFNLSIDGMFTILPFLYFLGHADCVEYVASFGLPTMVLGGGGYTVRNVARCWAYETSCLLNKHLKDELPFNDYYEYFAPDHCLKVTPNNMDNLNTLEYLEKCKAIILDNLNQLKGAPSVQMQDVPPDYYLSDSDDDMEDPDVRVNINSADKQVDHEAEFFEDDHDVEQDGAMQDD